MATKKTEPADDRPHFARALEAARTKAGLSQYRLSQLLGATKQAVAAFESGKRGPSWETVQRLVRVLGVPFETFADPDLPMAEAPEVKKGGRKPKDEAEATG